MEKNEILLSFAIPTYNRPKQFERLIKGLIPQVTSEVEIVIRDDSQNSLTEEIVRREIKARKIPFQYFKGEKIGADLAQLFLLEKSLGKYIWWFGDDDEILPGAIKHVIELVKKYPEIDYMWANFAYGDDKKLAISLPEEKFFKDRNEVIECLGPNIGLLSTMFLKREKGMLFLELGRENAIGFAFAILVPVMGALTGDGKFFFLRGPYVFNNPTTIDEIKEIIMKTGKIKNEGFNVYGVNFYQIATLFKDKFKKRSMKKFLANNFAALWRGMLVGWIGGWDTPKGKRWKMFKYYWNFPEFWIAMPLFLMPLWINKILFRIYKIFFSHRKWVFDGKFKNFFNRQ